jgi:MFS family permease
MKNLLRSRDYVIPTLASIVLVDALGYALVLPLIPFTIQRGQIPLFIIGVIFATYSLCQLVATPALGKLSDLYGRKPVLIGSLVGSAAGFVILALSPELPGIFASRIVDGLSAGNVAIVTAIVLDRTDSKVLGGQLATVTSAIGIGTVLGLAGSALIAAHGLSAAAAVAIALPCIGIVLVFFLVPESHQAASPAPQVWGLHLHRMWLDTPLRRAMTVAFIAAVTQSAFLLVLPIYIVQVLHLSINQAVGLIAVFVGTAGLFQLFVVPWIARRHAPTVTVYAGFALALLGGIIAAFATNLETLSAAALLSLFGAVMLIPATAAVLGVTRPEWVGQGTLMGLNGTAASAGQLIGPVVGYAALQIGGPPAYGGACALLAAGGGFACRRLANG